MIYNIKIKDIITTFLNASFVPTFAKNCLLKEELNMFICTFLIGDHKAVRDGKGTEE